MERITRFNLCQARKLAGLTKKAVAEKLGISVQTIGSYELYKTSPSYKTAWELSELYQIPMEQIIFFKK